MPDVLASLQCHVDVQVSDGVGMLLRYVSGYVPKFSDSFTTDWLSDAASDYCVARRVLTDYHPHEPEMTLQLAMQWFPQCFAGGTLQRFVVPVPWQGDAPERVLQYMSSEWRPPTMTLAEFLRKTNRSGGIHHAFRKRFQKLDDEAKAGRTLEEWVATAPCFGEVMTASIYLSRYNDKYYGQRTLMSVPLARLEDVWDDRLDLVPSHLRYQALALLAAPSHWRDPAAIRAELELEAFREHHVRDILAMLSANQGLIEKYFDGRLDKSDDADPEAEIEGALLDGGAGGDGKITLAPDQLRIKEEILDKVKAGMASKMRREEAWRGGDDGEDEDRDDEEDRSATAGAAAAQ